MPTCDETTVSSSHGSFVAHLPISSIITVAKDVGGSKMVPIWFFGIICSEKEVKMNDKLILVADDAAFMRKVIRMTLTEVGLDNIIEAKDGEEAVSLFTERHPDLVLLDITMEKKNGLEALAEMMEADPEAHVIMCTAIGQQQTVVDALAMGASDYVIKPFQKDKLVEAVLGVLNVA